MDLIIAINETKPGILHTTIRASGRATALEARMLKHIAGYANRALDNFDKQPDIAELCSVRKTT